MSPHKVSLLVVEDNNFDVRMLQRAMRMAGVDLPMRVANNGLEALEVLRGTADQAGLPRPNVVLLDINMPRMNGHEFLSEIRVDDALKNLVVFVHSTSCAPNDISQAYARNVAGYIVKEGRIESSVEDLKMLLSYTDRVELPLH